MSPGATFERVYLTLKEQVVSGAFSPGTALEPAGLSADLVASITPVRDALHRLAGERLVHTPRGDGFRMPIYTEASLRDLYGWNGRLLQLALAGRAPAASARPEAVTPPDEPKDGSAIHTGRLFLEVARLRGSGELAAAVGSVNDRLRAVRQKEALLLDPPPELAQIEQALNAREWHDLRWLIRLYHRRRTAAAPRLLEALQPSL
jgi:hypothetical protein